MTNMINTLEIKILMVCNLVFANFLFLFFLIIGLYILIAVVTTQIIMPTAEIEYY